MSMIQTKGRLSQSDYNVSSQKDAERHLRNGTSAAAPAASLSFSGCGFLGIYHIGVATAVKEYAPQLAVKVAGASAGAIAACALACDGCLGEGTSEVLKVAILARARALGPLHPSFNLVRILRERLRNFLPNDAHKKASGRLFISLTRFSDGKNVVVSEFDSKEELIQRYVDGGWSDNQPVLDSNTITISPFSGESDICPSDSDSESFMSFDLINTNVRMTARNMYRLAVALFPPHPEILSDICRQGFQDALRFLVKNNLITCTRCVAIRSCITLPQCSDVPTVNEEDYSVSTLDDEESSSEAEQSLASKRCSHENFSQFREAATSEPATNPAQYSALRDAENLDKNALGYLFRLRPVKFMQYMTIPWLLPFDIAYVVAQKILENLPHISSESRNLLWRIMRALQFIMKEIQTHRHQYSARFTCQLAITELNFMTNAVAPSRLRSRRPSSVEDVEAASVASLRTSQLNASPALKPSQHQQQAPSQQTKSYRVSRHPSLDKTAYAQRLQSQRLQAKHHLAKRQSTSAVPQQQQPSAQQNGGQCTVTELNFGFSVDMQSNTRNLSKLKKIVGRDSYDKNSSQHKKVSSDVHDLEWQGLIKTVEDTAAAANGGTSTTDANLYPLMRPRSATSLGGLSAISAPGAISRLSSAHPSMDDVAHAAAYENASSLAGNTSFVSQPVCSTFDEDVDAFASILEFSKNHESLMAYYYLDEQTKKVKVTEIFGVPDIEEPNASADTNSNATGLHRSGSASRHSVRRKLSNKSQPFGPRGSGFAYASQRPEQDTIESVDEALMSQDRVSCSSVSTGQLRASAGPPVYASGQDSGIATTTCVVTAVDDLKSYSNRSSGEYSQVPSRAALTKAVSGDSLSSESGSDAELFIPRRNHRVRRSSAEGYDAELSSSDV